MMSRPLHITGSREGFMGASAQAPASPRDRTGGQHGDGDSDLRPRGWLRMKSVGALTKSGQVGARLRGSSVHTALVGRSVDQCRATTVPRTTVILLRRLEMPEPRVCRVRPAILVRLIPVDLGTPEVRLTALPGQHQSAVTIRRLALRSPPNATDLILGW
jgi:hypothetical protein